MTTYCFILGNNPLLSLAEIFSFGQRIGVELRILDLTSECLVAAADGVDLPAWQAGLGGTIKIGRVIQEFPDIHHAFDYLTADTLQRDVLRPSDRKVVFGFSLYGDPYRRHQRELNQLGLRLKRELTEREQKARFIASKEKNLTSVQVRKHQLIERGADIIIAPGLYHCYVAVTETVQDFEAYSQRDYGRPQRDAASGMLPPKLAKMMVNLAAAPTDRPVLDPFCGSGTVLQEAALLGYTTLFGSDRSQQAVTDTKQNMGWLSNQRPELTTNLHLHRADVAELPQVIAPHSINAIVTEPYLGPALTHERSTIEMVALVAELNQLYLSAFASFNQVLAPGGRVCIVLPLFRTSHGIYSLNILEQLHDQGFSRRNPLPEQVLLFAKAGPTARGSLVYRREGQLVEREIFVFEKQ